MFRTSGILGHRTGNCGKNGCGFKTKMFDNWRIRVDWWRREEILYSIGKSSNHCTCLSLCDIV